MTSPKFHTPCRVHLVGIGGTGMSGIAEVLLTLGHQVSGSDLAPSAATRRLERLGARIRYGHSGDAVSAGVDVVVVSSAVRYSNPEVVRARELRIPVIPRAEMLAELMRLKQGIAVAGTHGKTTTTSLIATVLSHAGIDPTIVVGGRLLAADSHARLGQGELMVAEADESDGTFLLLSPVLAVVTNIDPEHLDFYGDVERALDAYVEFVNRIPFYGVCFLCLDSARVRAMLPRVRKRYRTYGTSRDAEWRAEGVRVEGMHTRFDVVHQGACLGSASVPLPGAHQALNALAAIAVAAELGVEFAVAAEALQSFRGIHRRTEVCGEFAGVTVVSDYAHHPVEIRATIDGVRRAFGRRLVVVFQPHRYTRTRDLFDDFLESFDGADVLILTEIYRAGEDPIPGVTGERLHQALRRRGHLDAVWAPDRRGLMGAVRERLQPGDVLLVLGAGDIHEFAEEMVALLGGASTETTQ